VPRFVGVPAVAGAVLLGALPIGPHVGSDRPGGERIRLLFLGDRGHHAPESRADLLAPALARLGIDLWFRADLAVLAPERLRHVDVVLVYANHDEIAPPQERALLDFVEGGGGLVAVHCASYCFRNSPEYVAMVGGQFDRHGMAEFTLRRVGRDHPALRGVAEFATTDETYVHRELARDRTVLQVRDEEGREEPFTWVREQGKGRVYYTALGHDARTWAQPPFHAQLAQAVRWAAGRPDFEFTPPQRTFTDARLPHYTPGARWGTEGEPIAKVQAPLSPEDERRLMQLPPGFDARLFASEPQVVKPIAMSFDSRGRLWVLESVDYPNDKKPGGVGLDRIKILEDRDGDGRADGATIFADGLNVPTGIICTEDGCIVAQAPDMVRFVDLDGDDRADERKVLFTGFGEGDTHAGPSNLRRDGPTPGRSGEWIWGTVGYSAFHGTVGGVEHRFGQAVFRFRSDGSKLERVAPTTNNTWGLGFDEQGEIFVSTANGDHLVHVAVPSPAIESVFGLVADGTVHVPDHDRLHPLVELRQVDYHGGFTAAAGCAIYTDRAFPPEYWNRCAFVCEPTGHLVHQCFLEPRGSTFVARDGRNLLVSSDEWCAPIAAEVGPDGAVWVLDWYSPVVQHNPTPRGFTTGKGNAYETPHRDKEHGRIWRIVWEEAEPRTRDVLDRLPEPALQDLASGHPNPLWREQADRRWIERFRPRTIRPDRLRTEPDPGDTALLEERRTLLSAVHSTDEEATDAGLSAWTDAAGAAGDAPMALAATIRLASLWSESLPRLLAADPTGASAPVGDDATLANPSFTRSTTSIPEEWRPVHYGGRAAAAWSEAGRASAGSAQLSSVDGADASFSQSVKVRPRGRYRLSGWIRTEGVTPLGDAHGALFNVHELQNPRVVTPAVTGTRGWTKVEVEFDSGDHERLTINCLLGGWGRARGTAWYDDVALELVSSGSPAAELVRTVATHAAHEDAARALDLIVPALAAAEPGIARAALEGLVRGWPREVAPPVALTPGMTALLTGAAPRLDVAGRAALLLVAERVGRLDLFPEEVGRVTAGLRERLADDAIAAPERVDAARRLLALEPAAEAVAAVAAQLSALAPPELVKGLLLALGESGAEEAGAEVARRAPQLSAATLPTAVELLLRRPGWTRALLELLAAGKLDAKSLAPDVLDRLRASGDPGIARLAAQIVESSGRPRNPDRAQVLERLLHVATKRGDAKRGAELFAAQCAKCHTMDGQGGPVGPDLTGIGKRGRGDLLLEILDPNRSVEGTWRAWDVTLKNGDSLTGRMVNEGRATLELVDAAAARHVIARGDVERLKPLTRSLMPEGFEDLGEADLAALLEFLVAAAGGDAPAR